MGLTLKPPSCVLEMFLEAHGSDFLVVAMEFSICYDGLVMLSFDRTKLRRIFVESYFELSFKSFMTL